MRNVKTNKRYIELVTINYSINNIFRRTLWENTRMKQKSF